MRDVGTKTKYLSGSQKRKKRKNFMENTPNVDSFYASDPSIITASSSRDLVDV